MLADKDGIPLWMSRPDIFPEGFETADLRALLGLYYEDKEERREAGK